MEKFGIFELLDALAAMTAQENAPKETPETVAPVPSDPAYRPPEYGTTGAQEQNFNENALNELLTRHETIAKKAEKRK